MARLRLGRIGQAPSLCDVVAEGRTEVADLARGGWLRVLEQGRKGNRLPRDVGPDLGRGRGGAGGLAGCRDPEASLPAGLGTPSQWTRNLSHLRSPALPDRG